VGALALLRVEPAWVEEEPHPRTITSDAAQISAASPAPGVGRRGRARGVVCPRRGGVSLCLQAEPATAPRSRAHRRSV